MRRLGVYALEPRVGKVAVSTMAISKLHVWTLSKDVFMSNGVHIIKILATNASYRGPAAGPYRQLEAQGQSRSTVPVGILPLNCYQKASRS